MVITMKNKKNKFIRIVDILIFTIALSLIIYLSLPFLIEFQNYKVNLLITIMISIIFPILIFIKAYHSKYKLILQITATLIAIPSIFISLFSLMDFISTKENKNPFLTKLEELKKEKTTYRLYLSNGGATTAYGIILQKEIELPLGVKVSSNIFTKYRAKDANISFLDKNTIRIKIAPYYKNDKVIIKDINI